MHKHKDNMNTTTGSVKGEVYSSKDLNQGKQPACSLAIQNHRRNRPGKSQLLHQILKDFDYKHNYRVALSQLNIHRLFAGVTNEHNALGCQLHRCP